MPSPAPSDSASSQAAQRGFHSAMGALDNRISQPAATVERIARSAI
jgi:hypothetical protein